jgi:hypothetical protein
MKPVPSTTSTRMPLRALAVGPAHGRTALAALVGALVVGILGMHALASHGNPAAHAASSSTLSSAGMPADHDAAMAAAESHAGHAHAAAAAGASAQGASTDMDAGASSGHGMNTMVMLCVVMLAAAALTLLVRLAGGPFRPLLPAAFKPAAVRERVLRWVRGTGPPPVWAFSVIRC